MALQLLEPRVKPPLDDGFRPAVLANRHFRRAVGQGGQRVVIGLQRNGSGLTRYETAIYPEGHAAFEANYQYVERVVKFLLWQVGGHTVYFGGPRQVADYLRQVYSAAGARRFDHHFMGQQVY